MRLLASEPDGSRTRLSRSRQPCVARSQNLPRLLPQAAPVIDAGGLSWRARRDEARNAGQEFTEPPPYDMRAFGDSKLPIAIRNASFR
jgi:hypothetical protein